MLPPGGLRALFGVAWRKLDCVLRAKDLVLRVEEPDEERLNALPELVLLLLPSAPSWLLGTSLGNSGRTRMQTRTWAEEECLSLLGWVLSMTTDSRGALSGDDARDDAVVHVAVVAVEGEPG